MAEHKGWAKRSLLAVAHVVGGWGLTTFSLVYLAPWTRIATLPALVTLFFSFPLALVGVLAFYFGSYEEIPGVAWVILSMMLGAGLMLLISMLFA